MIKSKNRDTDFNLNLLSLFNNKYLSKEKNKIIKRVIMNLVN